MPSTILRTIDDIPDLAFLHIISFLDVKQRVGIELVCKRWLSLSRASWAFLTRFAFPIESSASFSTDRRRVFETTLDLLDRMCHPLAEITALRALTLRIPPYPPGTILSKSDLTSTPEDPPLSVLFRSIARLCPVLESLSLDTGTLGNSEPLPEILLELFGATPAVEEPKLIHVEGTAGSVDAAPPPTSLDNFSVSQPPADDDQEGLILHDLDEAIKSVASSKRRFCGNQLKRLSIRNFHGLNDEVLREIVVRCPRLEVLDIFDAKSARGHFLQPINDAMVRLKSLQLCSSPLVDDESISAIIASPSAPTLEELKLNNCRRITGRGLEKLGTLVAGKTLKRLELSSNFRDVQLETMFVNGNNCLQVGRR